MNILWSLLIILCAVFGLYKLSEKQIKKTQQSKWSFLAIKPRITRFMCLFLLLISIFLLMKQQGFSIGFISFWIFLTPLLWLFIFCVNELKIKNKEYSK